LVACRPPTNSGVERWSAERLFFPRWRMKHEARTKTFPPPRSGGRWRRATTAPRRREHTPRSSRLTMMGANVPGTQIANAAPVAGSMRCQKAASAIKKARCVCKLEPSRQPHCGRYA
jgi:hypothetical protein